VLFTLPIIRTSSTLALYSLLLMAGIGGAMKNPGDGNTRGSERAYCCRDGFLKKGGVGWYLPSTPRANVYSSSPLTPVVSTSLIAFSASRSPTLFALSLTSAEGSSLSLALRMSSNPIHLEG